MFVIKGKDFEIKKDKLKFSFVDWDNDESVEIRTFSSSELLLNNTCDFELEGILTKDYDIIECCIDDSKELNKEITILKIDINKSEFDEIK